MAKGAASFESRGSSYEKQNRQPLQVFVTRYSRLADLRQHGSCSTLNPLDHEYVPSRRRFSCSLRCAAVRL
ncbi:hypothetical protein SAMN04515663_10160 [Alcanivorax sp. DSM 26293]|jgi:hypothetical protein|nr:hypothetical protein SAMN04515663_10160 [Alcanivorax sp. DSM 26293]